MTVFDVLAKRNADKLRAVSSPDARTRFELRLDEGGVGIMDAFDLFDGVAIVFNNIPQGRVVWTDREPCELQLDWCERGRFELETASGGSVRLGEGELAAHNERVRKRVMRYPLPLYTGFSLRIDRARGAAALAAVPALRGVDLGALEARLVGEEGCGIFSPDPVLRSLLGSFWDVDERAALDRLRLKTVELIALVAATPRFQRRETPYQQKRTLDALARSARLLESDLDARILLEDAAAEAGMSVSAFKERFVRAFGITPMAYRRQCRIERAAQLLDATDDGVARIAAAVGYRNPSKFSAAFDAACGLTPSEYRSRGGKGRRP